MDTIAKATKATKRIILLFLLLLTTCLPASGPLLRSDTPGAKGVSAFAFSRCAKFVEDPSRLWCENSLLAAAHFHSVGVGPGEGHDPLG